jgi:hypothetical protein
MRRRVSRRGLRRELGYDNGGSDAGEVRHQPERAARFRARDRNEGAGNRLGGPRVFLERNDRRDVARVEP